MLFCIFCHVNADRLISVECVFHVNRRDGNTISDDIIELCGPQNKERLKRSDAVCSSCMITIERAVTLKRHINKILGRNWQTQYVNKKPIKLSQLVNAVVVKFDDTKSSTDAKPKLSNKDLPGDWKVDEKVYIVRLSDIVITTNADTKSPVNVDCKDNVSPSQNANSPQNLLAIKTSVTYNPEAENIINQHSRAKCLSSRKPSSRCSTPFPTTFNDDESEDAEVRTLLEKPKRKRRRCKSTLTMPKKKKRVPSTRSEGSYAVRKSTPWPRPGSCFSVCSGRSSAMSVTSAATSISLTSTRASSRRRRYVPPSDRRTRSQGPVDDETEEQKLEFSCDAKECEEAFTSVEMLTDHKVKCHKTLLLHPCDMCNIKFVTEEDLSIHSENHYNLLYCFYCDKKTYSQRELQEHFSEHSKYNVLCLYCDKSFLNEYEKESHVSLHHPQKARKRIRNKHARKKIHSMWTSF